MGLKGIDNFIVKEAKVFTDRLILEKVKQVEETVLKIALLYVPVDTGKLKANIKTEITKIKNGYRVTIYVDLDEVEYAIYVELGTVKMQAQPYITPAVIIAHQEHF